MRANTRRIRTAPTAALLLVILALVLAGCVERTISITTQPSGALVYLNDEEVGRSPVVVPFTFHGTYDVRLEREGFEPLWTKAKTKDHWWELPGADLVAEAVPNGKSETHWHFELKAKEEVNPDALFDRAKALRESAQKKPTDEAEPAKDQKPNAAESKPAADTPAPEKKSSDAASKGTP